MIRSLTPDEMTDLMGVAAETGFGTIDTSRGSLPLRSLDVDVWIDGLTAHTTVKQQFVNVFDETLEATYVFPLPPRAAVTGFRMVVAGVTIFGRIDERQKARQDYDEALANGRRAAIAEQERPDVFTLRVGNIPARSAARVEFALVAPLAIDSLEATYRFPLVVAPRYCPGVALDGEPVGDGNASDTDLVPDASRISPPVMLPRLKSPVRLGITAHIAPSAMAGGTATADPIACSLPAEEEVDELGARVVTVVPEQRLDRDFILRWTIAADTVVVPGVLLEPAAVRQAGLGTGHAADDAAGDGTFAITIVPPAQARVVERPRDVVFVLDRSDSMEGWKMTAARRAVARMIDSLCGDDRVAAIAFDNVVTPLGVEAGLVAATDSNRWRLLESVATVEARGGTQIAAALTAGFDLQATAAGGPAVADESPRERFVVLVTDGQVGDEDRVLSRLQAKIGDIRLFVVGIDTAVNEGLLGRMADASGGQVELVESEDRLDEVMDRIHARLHAPLVTGITIEGDGIDVVEGSVVPGRIPDLQAGVPLVLRGRYRNATSAGRIRVHGRHVTGGDWQESAACAPGTVRGLGSMWAKGMLRQLEDRYAMLHEGHEELERRLVALSTSFGVLCRFTALVAIDDRDPGSRPDRPPRRIMQPVDVCRYMRSMTFNQMPSQDAYEMHFFERAFLCPDEGPEPGRVPAPDKSAVVFERAKALVARAKPRSGRLADVTPVKVRRLLRGVIRLLGLLGPMSGRRPLIERLATAYGRLYALPDDRPALVLLLDELATVIEEHGTADRWWTIADVDEPAPF